MRCFGCLSAVANSSQIHRIARDDEQFLKAPRVSCNLCAETMRSSLGSLEMGTASARFKALYRHS
jgi:hypothetical protein